MKIEVTEDDIKNGLQDECEACPIALAARRAGLRHARVFTTHLDWLMEPGMRHPPKTLPEEVIEFIDDFDSGRVVRPFSFELDVNP